MRFFARGWLMPTLPPMELSTMDEQGGGHADPVHAAHVGGGGEPREVADDTSAKGDHQPVAAQPRVEERVVEQVEGAPALARLGVRDQDARDVGPEDPLDGGAVMAPDPRARDDDRAARCRGAATMPGRVARAPAATWTA